MDADRLINRLAQFREILPPLIRGVPNEDLRWRPDDGHWSMLEVLAHLLDEEREDFRARLDSTLRDPDAPWTPIDPARWATARQYNELDPGQTLEAWMDERARSIDWLRSLGDVDWTVANVHPKFGAMRAGDLLAAWVAHDQLHLRQFAKRRWQLTVRDSSEYAAGYAGEWTA